MARFIDLLFPPQCAGCGVIGGGLCRRCAPPAGACIERSLTTLRVRALGSYDGGLRAAVVAVKSGRRDVAEALGARLAPLLAPDAAAVPVPTTAARRRMRGMDGVIVIAQHAARASCANVVPALRRTGSDMQRGRSREERLAANGRFICDASLVAGRRVVLVDDVCTTGTTLEDCARVVRAAGATVEEAAVIALA